jgi:2-polyprenyl-6-methoxyphenol hydroxylase-like FAD-dependent oxidoreductase
MMLGLLLARAGIETAVLEKHSDFLRDFRGDTVHPSTLEVMHELGLLDDLLRRPHQKVDRVTGQIGKDIVTLADFSHLPVRSRFIAFMPQWDFLDLLADEGRRYPGFHLLMNAGVKGLLERDGRVHGVRASTPDGQLEVEAELVIGADGRHSTVRSLAGLKVLDLGAPMDVFWMRLPRRENDPYQALGRIDAGKIFVLLNRGDYWQCAYVFPKGSADRIRARGIEAFRDDISGLLPHLADRVGALATWDDVKLLTVAVDRLPVWHRPGLLCIGDAAHAMSPIGGVGINLAIQDAVAAANTLVPAFVSGEVREQDLEAVQHRREFPTWLTQAGQITIQKRMISRVLAATGTLRPLWPVRLMQRWPVLQRIPARMIGMGVRPEHVNTPDILRRTS